MFDDHGRISPLVKRKRGEEKAAIPERRPRQVLKQSEKVVINTPAKEGTKNGCNTSQTHKTARTEKGGKTASPSTLAKTVNMTQLSDILQSSLCTAFAGLTESMKTGFANLGKLIQDTKITEDKEIGSESEVSDDKGSDENEPDGPPAKQHNQNDLKLQKVQKYLV